MLQCLKVNYNKKSVISFLKYMFKFQISFTCELKFIITFKENIYKEYFDLASVIVILPLWFFKIQ